MRISVTRLNLFSAAVWSFCGLVQQATPGADQSTVSFSLALTFMCLALAGHAHKARQDTARIVPGGRP
ncbi:hypothetical protein INH39_14410 [Massilia violaceinigra]|uniref:Uncharacterized protein n=1 Tax=Massilia violaceinigra TaxID=2045208 RepID=A0ABY4AF20_9BURK|nr:hypothetical protein [Massilia violaceinigra]UOD32745.1 hypothetical protein INH39_14410 [Massilia violaceinigra]